MESPKEMLEWFYPLFESARIIGGPPPHICSFADTVALRATSHTTIIHDIIYPLSALQINLGLTVAEWETLINKIQIYLKGHPSCHLSSKQYQIKRSTYFSKVASPPGSDPSSHSS